MDSFNPMSLPPRELVELVWSRRKLWLSTTAACGVLAAIASLIMPRYWEASQGLVVRQETAGSSSSRPGKFADLYEMRTLQETILEIAKSQQVVVGTIQTVDRALDQASAAPPSLEDIEKFRRRLKMLPPDGGEFGKTEVFYFSVRDSNRDRAIRLVGELCRQLEIALKQLRAERAGSLIAELEEEVKLTAELLESETQRLAEFETQVGADLGELRMLQSANSGQSDLRMESVQLEADVRKFRTQVREGEQLLQLLRAAESDPQQLVATPNSLLTSQPALRRLKDGLVDAQLATSRLSGTRSPDHPQVRAAVEAEQQIRTDLHNELVAAIRGAEVELQLSSDRLAATQERLDNLQQRFEHLAQLRAEYSNRVAALDNCRLTLEKARQNLGTAKAAGAAAHSGSLVTRLDEPETGPYPVGLGRTVITGAGGMAGLMLGLGFIFLFAVAPVHVETHDRAVERRVYGANAQPARASTLSVSQPLASDVPTRDAQPSDLGNQVRTDDVAPIKPRASAHVAEAEPRTPAAPAPQAEWWDAPATTPEAPLQSAHARSLTIAAAAAPAAGAEASSPPEVIASAAPKAVELEVLPPSPPQQSRPTQRETPRKRRESPVVAGALPGASAPLQTPIAPGTFGGMTLQEALRAAAAQMPN